MAKDGSYKALREINNNSIKQKYKKKRKKRVKNGS